MATGPDHYRRAEQLDHQAVDYWHNFPSGDAEADRRFAAFLVSRAHLHATLAVAAAIGGLDATEGPGGGSATGRMAGDGNAWLDALGSDEPHACVYEEPDGTTAGVCHLPGRHGGRVPGGESA